MGRKSIFLGKRLETEGIIVYNGKEYFLKHG